MTAALRQHLMAFQFLRWCSRLCLLAGGVLLISTIYVSEDAYFYQADQSRRFAASRVSETSGAVAQTPEVPSGSSVGRLEVSRIGLSVMVLEGVDAPTLRRGPGRVSGTARPGESGNMAIAAHRDTFFRPLRNIRKDDVIRFTTKDESFLYKVESIEVVAPTDVEVLDATSKPTLTLITCYPFFYVGGAPDRFVVRARLISPAANAAVYECGTGSSQ
jgi:sortase A